MKLEQMLEEKKEQIFYGIFLGLVLFASSALALSVWGDFSELKVIVPLISVVLAVYFLVGNLLVWLYEKSGTWKISTWFKGAAAIYWIGILGGLVSFISCFLPALLRYVLLVNLGVLIICWLCDYSSVLRMAKELNGQKDRHRYLVVDLKECPRGEEAFCREIEEYCRKGRIELEFINWGKPADILMNGEAYHVELDSFYSQFGPMYALKFRQE